MASFCAALTWEWCIFLTPSTSTYMSKNVFWVKLSNPLSTPVLGVESKSEWIKSRKSTVWVQHSQLSRLFLFPSSYFLLELSIALPLSEPELMSVMRQRLWGEFHLANTNAFSCRSPQAHAPQYKLLWAHNNAAWASFDSSPSQALPTFSQCRQR